uniref:Putative ixodes 10 kDa peptide protein n=1 Tax=Ixodes ricinus TaxID=34613 RepID=A0A0K8RBG5_IXORI
MYRNISNMLIELFAVVLALPASQGEESTSSSRVCFRTFSGGARIYCELFENSYFTRLHPDTGEFECNDDTKKVKLPQSVWPQGSSMSRCTPELLNTLQQWSEDLKKRKDSLIQSWCKCA